jgi:phage terminase large subunit
MITVKSLSPFKQLYNLPPSTNLVICIGGRQRGGAKTYEVSKYIAFQATIKEKRCVVLRDEKELVRESILNEVLLRFDTANGNGQLEKYYERLDTGLKQRHTNEMLVFSKGFRASSTAKKANLKSISNIDIAVIEEAEDIRDEEKFSTFADSIRKEASLIIVILNTPDIHHFLIKRYFHLEQVEDGYFDIIPKVIDGFVCIKTSYKDNPYLPPHIVSNYENYGNPDSHLYNYHYYMTAIKGYASTGRKGQVITKAKPIKLADYFKLPYKEHYGQDFGTSSPAGLIGVKKHRNTVWVRQINYKPMSTVDIGKLYCTLKLTDSDKIVADSADPKSISKLSAGWEGHELSEEEFSIYPKLKYGFNVTGARKGQDSVTRGIDLITSLNFFVVEESTDYWNEIYNYVYAQDKNGNYTNDPIDDFNHLIDPTRYVLLELETERDDWSMERAN